MPRRTGFKPRYYSADRVPDRDDPLDARELRFVHEYLVDLKGAEAAVRAGYAEKGARTRAFKLLRRPRVADALEQAFAERLKRTDVTADRVLRDIDTAANLDLLDLFDEHGRLRDIRQMPAYVRRCIVSIKVVKRNLTAGDGIMDLVHEIKLIDKAKMHEILAKHTGITREDATQPAANVPAFALPPETPGVSVH